MRRLGWVVLVLLVSLSVATADSYESSDPTGAWIAPGDTLSRNFSSNDDLDYLRFNVTDSRKYELLLFGNGSVDGELFAYRTDDTLLAYSDDDLRDLNTTDPRIRFVAGETGTMTLMAQEWAGATGTYSISLVERGVLGANFSLNVSNASVNSTFTAFINLTCTGGPCGNVTVTLDPYIDPAAKRNPDGELTIVSTSGTTTVPALEDRYSRIPPRVIERLRSRLPNDRAIDILRDRGILHDDVRAVYGELEVRTLLDTSVASIAASDVWSESTGSGSICVIDTGVDYTHPDLGGCTRTSNISDGSCDVVIGGYDFVNDDADPMDDDGHGTHVAGIVASRDAVYRGVAPNATIVAVKSLNSAGGGTIADVRDGVDYCLAHKDRFNITAIVMSLGTSEAYHGSCDRLNGSSNVSAAAAQIPTFAAAGNVFESFAYLGHDWPACVPGVIPIGSVDASGAPSSFSNRDLKTIFAPGESIRSAWAGGSTRTESGTSMAAPHGAGSAILFASLWNQRYAQELAPTSIRYLLELGDSIDDPFSDTSYTHINITKSSMAKGVVPTTPGARPFWTSNDNPVTCTLGANESCVIEWNVTAEGPIGTYVFFAFLEDEFDIITSPSDTLTLFSEFENLAYDPVPFENTLAIGSYNGTITLREDASAGWISIDAPGSNDLPQTGLTLEDNRTFTFERTILEDASEGEDAYTFVFTIGGSNVTVEHNASYSVDASYPTASAPSLFAKSGSFNVTFSELMNVSDTSVAFPSEAQVSLNASWLSDLVLEVDYASSNSSFDEFMNLSWNLADRAGNPAEELELRLDAQPPSVSLASNVSNLSVNESARITITPSETLSSLSYATPHLTCTNETSLLATQVNLSCSAIDGLEIGNSTFSFNLTDAAGNEANASVSSLRIDTLAPRIANVSVTTRTGVNTSVPITFNESALPISISTGDLLSGNASIMILADSATKSLTASDPFNNVASFDVSFTFDDTPPSTSINTSSAWQRGPVLVGFTVVDASPTATRITLGNGSVYTENFTISDEGEYALTYRSTDAAGNREGFKRATVRIDDTAPSVSVSISRTESERFVHVTATDALSGISSVAIGQNGSLDTTRSGSTWTASVSNGSVNVTVTDRASNTYVDSIVVPTLPEVFSDPVNGSYTNGSVALSFIGDELNYTLSNATMGSVANNASFTPAEGVFTITGNVTNNATTRSFFLSYTIDKTAPTMTIEAPSQTDGIVEINLSASDVSFDRVELLVNGSIVANGTSVSYELDPLSDGTGLIDLGFRAYDLAGNVNASNATINVSLPSGSTAAVQNGSVTFARSGIGSYVRTVAGLDSTNATINVSSAASLDGLDELIANVSIVASTSGGATVEFAIPVSAPSFTLWRVSNATIEELSYTNVSTEGRLRIIRFSTPGFSDFVLGTEYDSCSEGAVSSACMCGSSVVSSGYCCSGSAQSTSCTAQEAGSSSGSGGGSSGGSSSSFVSSSTEPDNETQNATAATNETNTALELNETLNTSDVIETNGSEQDQNTTGTDTIESSSAPPVAIIAGVLIAALLGAAGLFFFKRRASS